MAYVAGMLTDSDRYLASSPADPVGDGAGYAVAALWLTDGELADFRRDLSDLVQPRLANGPSPGRRRRMLYTILLPEPQKPAGPPGAAEAS
jgi:hypothetical protein